nr:MAG TPA: hypothetical protein [Bacteriophage sp.]
MLSSEIHFFSNCKDNCQCSTINHNVLLISYFSTKKM